VQNQAPTDISQQLKGNASFQPTQDLFNTLGGAGFTKASYSVVNGELDVNLDQEQHTINVGVGQIQDPYLVGGSGRYYDEAAVDFDLYNDMAPYNQPSWVPDPSNPTYDVKQSPWQIDDDNYDNNPYPLDTPTDNVYFQSTRNGRPGADILQDLAPTFLQEVVQNEPLAPQTGDYTLAQGGGIYVNYRFNGTVDLTNTIVAGNHAADGPDLHGNVTSSDHDLIGDGTGFFLFTSTGDLIGGQNGNPPLIDPLLNPLGFYGGPTQTMPEKVDSPAIDAGDDSALVSIAGAEGVPVSQATDQRGQPRLFGAHIDIGATEARVIKLKPVHGGSSGAAPPGGHHPGLIPGAVNLAVQDEVEAPTSTRRTPSRDQSGGMSGVSIFPGPFDLGLAVLDFEGIEQILAEVPPSPIHPPSPAFPLFPPGLLGPGEQVPGPVHPLRGGVPGGVETNFPKLLAEWQLG
jgi:hypothetical protein